MSAARAKSRGVSAATVRRLVLALPGVEDGSSYGMPSFKVGKKFLARIRSDGALAVKLGSFEDRDYLLSHDPAVFYTTDHYRDYPTVLIRLDVAKESDVRDVLTDAWRRVAPRKTVEQFDAGQ